jgi:hypothetical protein
MLVYDDKPDIAEATEWVVCHEPTNEEIYIQETSALKETNTKKRLNY